MYRANKPPRVTQNLELEVAAPAMPARPNTFVIRCSSAAGYLVEFGDGTTIDVSEQIIRSEQDFRQLVRFKLGKVFAPSKQSTWLDKIIYAMAEAEAVWIDEAYERYLDWMHEVRYGHH